MSRKMMYFGTKDRMDWIPCPAVDRPASLQSPSGTLEYENGGAFVRRQYAGHRNYELTWNFLPNSEAEKIEAWAQGIWGRGPYYWVDPMIARGNMLPMDWAFPGSVHLGAAPLLPVEVTDIPVPNPLPGSPVRGVRYATDTNFLSSSPRRVFLPIPPEHTLTFATSAISNRLNIFVQTYPTAGGDPSAGRQVQSSEYGGHFETFRGDVVRGIELYIGSTPGGTGTRSIDLHWMTAVLQPGLISQPTLPSPPRNVFTNPRLEGSGVWAEVRRNRVIDPLAITSTISGYFGMNQPVNGMRYVDTPTDHPLGIESFYMMTAENDTSTWWRIGIQGTSIPVTPGETITASAWGLSNLDSKELFLNLLWRDASGGAISESQVGHATTSGAFAWLELSHSMTVPANAAYVFMYVRTMNSVASEILAATGFQVESGGVKTELIVGSRTPSDPDMRTRWLGAENASASVLEIEEVRGVLATRCIAGKSTLDGKPAIRQIPTSAGERHITIPGITGWGDKTLLVNVSVPDLEDWTGLAWQPGSIQYSATPWTQLYREDDDFPYLWREYNPGAPGYRLRHSSGSTSQFDGDVYWTDLGVYEGEYTGPPADGDTPGWAWEGEPGNSPSVNVSYRPSEIPQWTPGIGHSGCEFTEHPERVDYSAALDKVGVTANLKEVGSWL